MSFTKILNYRELTDIEMFHIGGYLPLTGFTDEKNYYSILNDMRLVDGRPWPLPITLSLTAEEYKKAKDEDIIYLKDEGGKLDAHVEVQEIFKADKDKEAESVYGSDSLEHPGVKVLFEQGDYYAAGRIVIKKFPEHTRFKKYYLTPAETKEYFKTRGWRRIVAFQTRNPIHRAHEYLQKCALEISDGLFIHPIVGATKTGDIPADVRMRCYEALIDNYYPGERILLGINPASMRYAGPREAIFHALIRRNYGCTHIIIGRDHAGVGGFYGPYDAQKIFDEFEKDELGIQPLFFENAFWCEKCEDMVTLKTCPHSEDNHISLSGTRVRGLLAEGKLPPRELTRPEVAEVLLDWWQSKG